MLFQTCTNFIIQWNRKEEPSNSHFSKHQSQTAFERHEDEQMMTEHLVPHHLVLYTFSNSLLAGFQNTRLKAVLTLFGNYKCETLL